MQGKVDHRTAQMRDTPKNKWCSIVTEPSGGRAKRKTSIPSRFMQKVPPSENKPRSEKVKILHTTSQTARQHGHCSRYCILFSICMTMQSKPLKPKRNVWILHPEFPNETIGIGKSGPSWRANKKTWIPNVDGVSWEPGMQQVKIDHVYPQYADVSVLNPTHQRPGILKMSDALDGQYVEDSTIVWQTRYLNYVES